jgi:hypothetical protein
VHLHAIPRIGSGALASARSPLIFLGINLHIH